MLNLFEQDVDWILVESSGFSDPRALGNIFAFLKKKKCQFDALSICVVDARSFIKLSSVLPILNDQVSSADVVLINKIDQVSVHDLISLKEKIQSINPKAKKGTMQYGQINLENILRACDHQKDLALVEPKNLWFRSFYIQPIYESIQDLQTDLGRLMGKVYRIKGYVLIDDQYYKVDMCYDQIRIHPFVSDQNVLVFLYDSRQINKTRILECLKLNRE